MAAEGCAHCLLSTNALLAPSIPFSQSMTRLMITCVKHCL